MALTIGTTLYAYARLDFVRSYETRLENNENHQNPVTDK